MTKGMTIKKVKSVSAILGVILLTLSMLVGLTVDVQAALPSARTISIFRIDGTNVSLRNGRRTTTPRARQRLSAGNVITTGADTQVFVQMDRSSILQMGANSQVAVASARRTLTLSVQSGNALISAGPQGEAQTLTIRMGNVGLTVRGTMFTVSHGSAGQVQIVMLTGEGEVNGIVLPAGSMMSITADDGAPADAHEITPLDFNAMNSFTLTAILENSEYLLNAGVIDEEILQALPVMIGQVQYYEEQELAALPPEEADDEYEGELLRPSDAEDAGFDLDAPFIAPTPAPTPTPVPVVPDATEAMLRLENILQRIIYALEEFVADDPYFSNFNNAVELALFEMVIFNLAPRLVQDGISTMLRQAHMQGIGLSRYYENAIRFIVSDYEIVDESIRINIEIVLHEMPLITVMTLEIPFEAIEALVGYDFSVSWQVYSLMEMDSDLPSISFDRRMDYSYIHIGNYTVTARFNMRPSDASTEAMLRLSNAAQGVSDMLGEYIANIHPQLRIDLESRLIFQIFFRLPVQAQFLISNRFSNVSLTELPQYLYNYLENITVLYQMVGDYIVLRYRMLFHFMPLSSIMTVTINVPYAFIDALESFTDFEVSLPWLMSVVGMGYDFPFSTYVSMGITRLYIGDYTITVGFWDTWDRRDNIDNR
jgi:hypothetical protein